MTEKRLIPSQLAAELKRIVSEETGCLASWEQHPDPISQDDLRWIFIRIVGLFGRIGTFPEHQSQTAIKTMGITEKITNKDVIAVVIQSIKRRCRQIALDKLSLYPTTIFSEPKDGSPPDCYAAAGCRLVAENIAREIEELDVEESRDDNE